MAGIKPLKYPLIFFGTALAISVICSPDKLKSSFELYKYAGGLFLFLASASLTGTQKIRLIRVIVLSGIGVSILAIYQYFFGFRHTFDYMAGQDISGEFALNYIRQNRAFAPFVTPNMLGGYAAMIIPLALTLKGGIFYILPLCLTLLLSKSLGAILSLLLAMLVYFYLQDRIAQRKIILLSMVFLTLAVIFTARLDVWKDTFQPAYSASARLKYVQQTLKIIQKNPLTGVGPGNFNLPRSRYAHNSYLQIWAETGILGIISAIWLIIAVFKNALKSKIIPAGIIISAAVFLFHNLIDFTFFLPEVSFIWWTILGLTYYRNGSTK